MSAFYQLQSIVAFLTIASTFKMADAKIVVPPKDVEAELGSSVFFNCSLSDPGTDVQWNVNTRVANMQVVYAFGKINSNYVDRFSVQNGHNLHIASVTVDDAGTYECQDDYGHGERHSAELCIIVTNPICQSNLNLSKVIGKNSWGIEPSQVTLSCSVQFQGNKAPTLEWTKGGEETAITSGISYEIRSNRVLHNLTIKGDLIANGSSYNCRPGKAATAMVCNTGTITIIGASNATCQHEPCQSYIAAIIFISVIACAGLIILSVLLYRFIKVRIEKKTGSEEEKNLLPNRIKEADKKIEQLQAENKLLRKENKDLTTDVEDLESRLYHSENVDYTEKPLSMPPIELNGKMEIKGLAVIENRLFILRENCSEMEIYELDKKSCLSFSIKGIQAPFDMTYWHQGDSERCLFIIGEITNKEEKHSADNNKGNKETTLVRVDVNTNTLISKWSKKSWKGKGRLSTFKSSVIILFSGLNIITEFSVDGVELETVGLHELGIRNKLHAVKVNSRHFALSSRDDEDGQYKINIIDRSGTLIKKFEEKSSGVPYHFLICDDGSFLVADGGDHCIRQHRPDITKSQKLIEMETGNDPVRLAFDETQQRLFVGIQKRNKDKSITAQVNVYNIRR